MNLEDTVYKTGENPQGEVFLRPFDSSGKPLSDPLSIFHNRTIGSAFLKNDGARKLFEDHGIITLGDNLVVNNGRQVIANLLGGRDFNSVTPDKSWVISSISFGTYDEVPRFTDVTLSPQPSAGLYVGGENEIAYDGVNYKKPLVSVDWPQPFIVRFEAILGNSDCNGVLIRELGLWTYNESLFARKAIPALAKSDEWGSSILWRVRC